MFPHSLPWSIERCVNCSQQTCILSFSYFFLTLSQPHYKYTLCFACLTIRNQGCCFSPKASTFHSLSLLLFSSFSFSVFRFLFLSLTLIKPLFFLQIYGASILLNDNSRIHLPTCTCIPFNSLFFGWGGLKTVCVSGWYWLDELFTFCLLLESKPSTWPI